VAEVTTNVTIGRTRTPVNDGRVCGCKVILDKRQKTEIYINVTTEKQMSNATATLIQNITSVNTIIGVPHFGTAT
jgi:hypothetical protein